MKKVIDPSPAAAGFAKKRHVAALATAGVTSYEHWRPVSDEQAKFRLGEAVMTDDSGTLYPVIALRSFGDVKTGDVGGLVESEHNLSHHGLSWIYEGSRVVDDALVTDNAVVRGKSVLSGNARVSGDAVVEDSVISDNCVVTGAASVVDSTVSDDTLLYGEASVRRSIVRGTSTILEGVQIVSCNVVDFSHDTYFFETCDTEWRRFCRSPKYEGVTSLVPLAVSADLSIVDVRVTETEEPTEVNYEHDNKKECLNICVKCGFVYNKRYYGTLDKMPAPLYRSVVHGLRGAIASRRREVLELEAVEKSIVPPYYDGNIVS